MKQFVSTTAVRLLVLGAAVVLISAASSRTVAGSAAAEAMQGRGSAPGQQKKFRATRAIVPDAQSGQYRMPTEDEIAQVVDHLATMTSQPESLPEVAGAGSTVSVELGGGFNGVVLARPGDGGALETRCVFTFEEGLEFLGLVEIVQ
jgi:hypothetical protein